MTRAAFTLVQAQKCSGRRRKNGHGVKRKVNEDAAVLFYVVFKSKFWFNY